MHSVGPHPLAAALEATLRTDSFLTIFRFEGLDLKDDGSSLEDTLRPDSLEHLGKAKGGEA